MFKKLLKLFEPSLATPTEAELPKVSPMDQVDELAGQMTDRQAVEWAAKSTELVQDQTTPADLQAGKAAAKWAANPTAENSQLAAQAAQVAQFKGPGALSAQSAALSTTMPSMAAQASQIPNMPLSSEALAKVPKQTAADAVKLAASMKANPPAYQAAALQMPDLSKPMLVAPKFEMPSMTAPTLDVQKISPPQLALQHLTPPQQREMVKAYQPFLDLGKSILNSPAPKAPSPLAILS